MSLKNVGGHISGFRHTWFVFLSLIAFLLIGCGGSEEATMEATKPGETAKPLGTVAQEKPKETKPMDQALTSFVGADNEKVAEVKKPAVVAPSKLSQYEKQIEDLKAENTGLKQKNVKLEQENRITNARINEIEARYAAEKIRADKAEELGKNAVPESKTESKAVSKAVSKAEEENAALPSESSSSYDDALSSFNSREYDAAAQGFQAIIDGGSDDEETSRATYWLGETRFAQKKYNQALPLFQKALKMKVSEKKADAQYMIAQTYECLGNKVKAKEAYEKAVKNFPMSKNVKRAKARWAKL
jgi:TolA-binding protein